MSLPIPQEKPTHGGARPGAGRKPTGQPWRPSMSVTLEQEAADRIHSAAVSREVSYGVVVGELAMKELPPARIKYPTKRKKPKSHRSK